MKSALEISELTKKYDDFLLDRVSLSLPEGSIMGFIGENGAGKSTTIKLILGLIHSDGGTISVLGSDGNIEKELFEQVGVVMDECGFSGNLTAENVNIVLKNCYKTWDEARFRSYVKQFSISPKKRIKDYSRGMTMKLSIAAALSHDSRLLILDEATSGLDPIVRDEILDVFLDFVRDGKHSIFISSHIISDLEKICDYITLVHNGKIILSETKNMLLDKYGVVRCSEEEFSSLDKSAVAGFRRNSSGVEVLVLRDKIKSATENASIEDIMLYYVKEGSN